MANTTNFGWETPDDTDLVKDGASAMRTLGNAIDTSLVDLKGGTTGQYLKKNSNTDLDYVWGDVSSGGMTSLASGSIASSATGVDISSINGTYNNLFFVCRNISVSSTAYIEFRLNNDSGSDYSSIRQYIYASSAYNGLQQGATSCELGILNSAQSGLTLIMNFWDYANTSAFKTGFWSLAAADNEMWQGSFVYRDTGAINRLQIIVGSGTFDAGTYQLYGVK